MPEKSDVRRSIDDAMDFHRQVTDGINAIVDEARPDVLTIGGAAVGGLLGRRLLRRVARGALPGILATGVGAAGGGAIGYSAGQKVRKMRNRK